MYEDKTIVCRDCRIEFPFSAGEQQFFAEKGFKDPLRCKECRGTNSRNSSDDRPRREMFDTVCSNCGDSCRVPFEPTGTKPVYCSECFKFMK